MSAFGGGPDAALATAKTWIVLYCVPILLYGFYIAVSAAVSSLLVTQLYLPALASYRDGCVSANPVRGTLLQRNVFALVQNQAMGNGDAAFSRHSSAFNSRRASDCVEYGEDINRKADADAVRYEDYLERARESEASLRHYAMCSNGTSAGGGPVATALAESTCNGTADAWPGLARARFDCRNLPVVNLTCGQPSREALSEVSEQCTCLTEWYLHARAATLLAALLLYAVLNVSRAFVAAALPRLLWRKVTDRSVTLTAEVDAATGEFPPCDTKERLVRVKAAVDTLELQGRVALGAAGGFFLAFFSLLLVVPSAGAALEWRGRGGGLG